MKNILEKILEKIFVASGLIGMLVFMTIMAVIDITVLIDHSWNGAWDVITGVVGSYLIFTGTALIWAVVIVIVVRWINGIRNRKKKVK